MIPCRCGLSRTQAALPGKSFPFLFLASIANRTISANARAVRDSWLIPPDEVAFLQPRHFMPGTGSAHQSSSGALEPIRKRQRVGILRHETRFFG